MAPAPDQQATRSVHNITTRLYSRGHSLVLQQASSTTSSAVIVGKVSKYLCSESYMIGNYKIHISCKVRQQGCCKEVQKMGVQYYNTGRVTCMGPVASFGLTVLSLDRPEACFDPLDLQQSHHSEYGTLPHNL